LRLEPQFQTVQRKVRVALAELCPGAPQLFPARTCSHATPLSTSTSTVSRRRSGVTNDPTGLERPGRTLRDELPQARHLGNQPRQPRLQLTKTMLTKSLPQSVHLDSAHTRSVWASLVHELGAWGTHTGLAAFKSTASRGKFDLREDLPPTPTLPGPECRNWLFIDLNDGFSSLVFP